MVARPFGGLETWGFLGLLLCASLLGSLAGDPDADHGVIPDAALRTSGTPFTSANEDYRFVIPDGWFALNADPTATYLLAPSANSSIGITWQVRCGNNTLAAAQEVLDQDLAVLSSYTLFELMDGPHVRWVAGHAAAEIFFSHMLADGRIYELWAVILGPEWSKAWRYTGAMGNLSELALSPVINATLDTFEVLPAPQATRLVNEAKHFALQVPLRWDANTSVVVNGVALDALLTPPDDHGNLLVDSDTISLQGTAQEARDILQATLDQLSTEPGFRIVDSITDRSLDAHAAAVAVVAWQPSTYDVLQEIYVILGPEWSRAWILIGTTSPREATSFLSCVNVTANSFDVLPAPPSVAFLNLVDAYRNWILVGGLVATGAEGAVLGTLVVRQLRRRR